MLAQVSANLSGVSLVVSIVALLVAIFSLPASIKQYVVWIRDAALWLALAFVTAVVLKVGYQRSYDEGKPVSQVVMELLGRKTEAANNTEEPTSASRSENENPAP
jgi:hypothetical protein